MFAAGHKSIAFLILIAGSIFFSACSSLPTIATDVTYCCQTGYEGVRTYRVEFVDMPEFLKPMLRGEASIVLDTKGLEYTESDAHAILLMTFVNRTLSAEESARDEAWETIAPGGGVRFIAEVQLELKNSVTGDMLWAGTMGRMHNVYEGSYMHDAPAKSAMRNAFLEIFADYPDSRIDVQ
jgi:hypothetical protein